MKIPLNRLAQFRKVYCRIKQDRDLASFLIFCSKIAQGKCHGENAHFEASVMWFNSPVFLSQVEGDN